MDEKLLAKERAIIRLHLIYGFVILAILSISLLVIVPGSINQKAFDNFCFASTIVSIVLAVVSIVYSFRTKNNASDNMAGIREVERSIDEKLHSFDELEKRILMGFESCLKSGINPLYQDVSSIHDDQVEIRERIEQFREEMLQRSSAKESKEHLSNNKDSSILARFKSNSFLGDVALYLACKSFKAHKAIDLSKISDKLEKRKDYLFGYLIAIVVIFPDNIEYKSENGSIIREEFTKFDDTFFGNEEECRRRVESFKVQGIAKEFLDAIDLYFQ